MSIKDERKANFPNRIKSLRVKHKLSQRELAKVLGVSPGAVAHWESGERQVSGPIQKLIEIFESKSGKKLLERQ